MLVWFLARVARRGLEVAPVVSEGDIFQHRQPAVVALQSWCKKHMTVTL